MLSASRVMSTYRCPNISHSLSDYCIARGYKKSLIVYSFPKKTPAGSFSSGCFVLCVAIFSDAAGVDDGLGVVFAAEHNEEVRDHLSLLVVVEAYDVLFLQLVEGHLHH